MCEDEKLISGYQVFEDVIEERIEMWREGVREYLILMKDVESVKEERIEAERVMEDIKEVNHNNFIHAIQSSELRLTDLLKMKRNFNSVENETM